MGVAALNHWAPRRLGSGEETIACQAEDLSLWDPGTHLQSGLSLTQTRPSFSLTVTTQCHAESVGIEPYCLRAASPSRPKRTLFITPFWL